MSVVVAVYSLLSSKEPLASLRSPCLVPPPLPPSTSAATSNSTISPPPTGSPALSLFPLCRTRSTTPPAPLTEHALQALHLNWHLRLRSLSDRVIALLSAKAAGEASCWAGKATENHIRTVQRAADEAKFVEERLRKAVRWCRREKVGKVPVKGLIKAAAGARKKHGPSSLRPVHSTFPPSLLDLPYPLPQAQEPNLYTLSLPSFSMTPFPETPRRRRPQERDEEREAQQGEALPVYRALADEQAGERTVQRAEMGGVGGEEQYARELAELLRE